jgi:hypothetical protein
VRVVPSWAFPVLGLGEMNKATEADLEKPENKKYDAYVLF